MTHEHSDNNTGEGMTDTVSDRYRFDILDARSEFLANGAIWCYAVQENLVMAALSIKHTGGDCYWINDLYVCESCRREGVATALVSWAMRMILASNRVVAFSAGINCDNTASLDLFRKLGFAVSHAYDGDTGKVYMVSKSEVAA